jgi:hypothetical protein
MGDKRTKTRGPGRLQKCCLIGNYRKLGQDMVCLPIFSASGGKAPREPQYTPCQGQIQRGAKLAQNGKCGPIYEKGKEIRGRGKEGLGGRGLGVGGAGGGELRRSS